jgi:Zn-dependent peptidase ImmA (M78 family)
VSPRPRRRSTKRGGTKRGTTAPALPGSVWSALGPVAVVVVKDLKADDGKPLLGQWDPATRVIQIREGMNPVTALQVCAHEWIHAVLGDAGVHLLDEQEESVADALSTAITADILSQR